MRFAKCLPPDWPDGSHSPGPEGLAAGADGGQKELRVGAQKEEAGIGGALLNEFEQDVLPRLVQQFRVLQEVDLPRRLVGQDVGVRPQGPDGLGLQPLPLRIRPDNVWVDPLGGLPAAGAVAAGGPPRCTPRRRPAGPPAGGGSPPPPGRRGPASAGPCGFLDVGRVPRRRLLCVWVVLE